MINSEEIIEKLKVLYDKEKQLQEGIEKMITELQQTKDDIEMMETTVMYQSNKLGREK